MIKLIVIPPEHYTAIFKKYDANNEIAPYNVGDKMCVPYDLIDNTIFASVVELLKTFDVILSEE